MRRHEVLLGGPNEQRWGLARAVRVGPHVCVGGTAPIRPDGTNVPVDDVEGQVRRCYEIVGEALRRAGAAPSDVVRTRTLLVRIEDAPVAIRVRKEFLGETMPVETIVQVTRFVDPEWMVEIEVDAIIAGDASDPGDHGGSGA